MARWALRALLVALLVGGFLAGLVWVGYVALDRLRDQPRYEAAFADIECAEPPTQSRKDFLDEVQYLGKLPDRLRLLDAELPRRLDEAFAAHPWVEKVDEVKLTPPRQVQVRLTYRRPVLAVRLGTTLRAVDSHGVLLRPDAPTQGLPVYEGLPKPPLGSAGTKWGDPGIEAKARLLRK